MRNLTDTERKDLRQAVLDYENLRAQTKRNKTKLLKNANQTSARDFEILIEAREALAANIKQFIAGSVIFQEFFSQINGCDPVSAAVLLSFIDIHKAATPAHLWSYSGLGLKLKDGSSSYSVFLKKQLMGTLASCLIAANGSYSGLYFNTLQTLNESYAHANKTTSHKTSMARRVMIKRFLVDLYIYWRSLYGLPTVKPFPFEYRHISNQEYKKVA